MKIRLFRCLVLSAFLLLLSIPGFTSMEEAGKGMVYGPGHAYVLGAPTGWIFDNESGRSQGMHAVIYPKGGSWAGSRVVIYSGTTAKAGGNLQGVVAEDLAKFRKADQGLQSSESGVLTTGDGREATIRDFVGDKIPNFERVAYIDTPEVVCEIIMTARDRASFDQGLSAFEDVVRSFRFLAVDSDEYIRSERWKVELDPSK